MSATSLLFELRLIIGTCFCAVPKASARSCAFRIRHWPGASPDLEIRRFALETGAVLDALPPPSCAAPGGFFLPPIPAQSSGPAPSGAAGWAARVAAALAAAPATRPGKAGSSGPASSPRAPVSSAPPPSAPLPPAPNKRADAPATAVAAWRSAPAHRLTAAAPPNPHPAAQSDKPRRETQIPPASGSASRPGELGHHAIGFVERDQHETASNLTGIRPNQEKKKNSIIILVGQPLSNCLA